MTLCVYREPFGFTPRAEHHTGTIAQMVARMRLPPEFSERGVVCINGQPVPRDVWPMVHPKPGITEVTFHLPPAGGGGGGGKQVLAMVAAIALTAGTAAIAGGSLATAGGWFAKGSISALALASGTAAVGSLLLGALTAPPTFGSADVRDTPESSADGNVLAANGPIPRVVGERKVFPPFAVEPFIYFDGQDEVVEAVYCLAGPHRLRDIRFGTAAISEMASVQYQTREGWPADSDQTLVARQTKTEQLQAELKGYTTQEDNQSALDITDGIASALPVAQNIATRVNPNEHWLQFVFPAGLSQNGDTHGDQHVRVPLRIRIRREGTTEWINLPELHYEGASLQTLRATVKLRWVAEGQPGSAPLEGWLGWTEGRIANPAQTIAPGFPAWQAHPWFSGAGTYDFLSPATAGASRVRNLRLSRYDAIVYLAAPQFPRGRYEIEVARGCGFKRDEYNAIGYTYQGEAGTGVYDLFQYAISGTTPVAPHGLNGMSDRVMLLRSVSMWNDKPVPSGSELALIAVKARNRQLGQLSAVAGGYVQDWDGSGWSDWQVTSNPAPHLRDIYVGSLNAAAVPEDIIDNGLMTGFRQHCIDRGYTVNALIEGRSMIEAARVVAACGYGQPYASEVWGVIWDRDRSAETPVQIFTPRNTANFSWEKAFSTLPDGFLVTYSDRTLGYESRQITVLRDGITVASRLLEQVTYDGIDTEAAAIARARFDLRQLEQRAVYYSVDAPAEAVVCRRGSLVGVQHHSLDATTASGRVVAVDGNTLRIDNVIPGGTARGIVIRQGGIHIAAIADGADSTEVTLLTAIPVAPGALFSAGPIGTEVARMIVFSVEPHADLTATLTLVDEAPGLWA